MKVKMELRPTVDETMRQELIELKDAMKRDYENMKKDLPEIILIGFPRISKKTKVKKEKKLMDIGDAMKVRIIQAK